MKFIWGGDELGFYPPMIFKNTLKGGKMIKNKKAQMNIGDAPAIVLIVGLIFLTMATVAVISDKYGNAIDTPNVAGVATAEAVTQTNLASATGASLNALNLKDGANCAITAVTNGSSGGGLIGAGNYTEITDCHIKNVTSTFVTSNWYVNYTYTYSRETVASNLTIDLNTELGNNSSIAGIVLTISLVGIILGILVVVFFRITRRSNRL
jgi:hypothetical protein